MCWTAVSTGCSEDDFACYCKSPASDADLSCVSSVCDASDTQEWVVWAQELCAAYGGLVTSAEQASAASTAGNSPATTAFVVATSVGGSASFVTVTQAASTGGSVSSADFSHATGSAVSVNAQSTSNSVNPGVIAGPVVGGVAVLALLAALAVYLKRKNRNSPIPPETSNPGAAPATSAISNSQSNGTAGGAGTSTTQSTNFGSGVDSAPVSSGKQPEVVEHEVGSEAISPLSF
ncbi:hypothetical protein MMC10_008900 [Thelotrema lepadinum]|nr:hypothetical protein [Thelotrema lepadinum]